MGVVGCRSTRTQQQKGKKRQKLTNMTFCFPHGRGNFPERHVFEDQAWWVNVGARWVGEGGNGCVRVLNWVGEGGSGWARVVVGV